MNLIEFRRIRLGCLAPVDWRTLRVSNVYWIEFLAATRLQLFREGQIFAVTGPGRAHVIGDTSHHAENNR